MRQNKWWQSAVFYQIYPRSFADSNGDGIGDLGGIIQNLDYFQDLGINAIWLSPHYPSPLFDCGYDVSDYQGVATEYGSIRDFKTMVNEAHKREIFVVTDFVLNHTSIQHPWFIESRSSRDNPKRDWYIWKEGRYGGPPNNWCADFESSAWEYDPLTDQYYYHFFFHTQPDLNWRNPEVKKAVFQAMKFWLALGVDGFRLDAVDTLFEDPLLTNHDAHLSHSELYHKNKKTYPELPDDPYLSDQRQRMFKHQQILSEAHQLLKEIRLLVDQYPNRILIGETDDIGFYGDGSDELDLIFNFQLMRTPSISPQWIRDNQRELLNKLPMGVSIANTLGNHDSSRISSRFGANKPEVLPLLAAIPLLLPGTPFLYYGEEIGMADNILISQEEFKDQLAIWMYQTEINLFDTPPAKAFESAVLYGRDKCRTPMQWNRQPNAGFCPPGVRPWLPINPNYIQDINVETQQANDGSLWHVYKRLIHLRKSKKALAQGAFEELKVNDPACLAFIRRKDKSSCLIALNISNQHLSLNLESTGKYWQCCYSSKQQDYRSIFSSTLELHPYEVFIADQIKIKNSIECEVPYANRSK